MTWWIQLYLFVFVALSIGGLWDDYRDHRPLWFLVVAGFSNIILIYLFGSFWKPFAMPPEPLVARILFIAAIGWEVYQAVLDFKNLENDSDYSRLSPRANMIAATLLSTALSVPVYIVAGMTAFRS